MKILFLTILFAAVSMFGQTIVPAPSPAAIPADTISVADLVRAQIEKAKEKQKAAVNLAVPAVNEKLTVNASAVPTAIGGNWFVSFIVNQPVQYKLFFSLSILIICFVVFRRIIDSIRKRASKAFKKRIEQLREDKVESRIDAKLQVSRRKLRSSKSIYDTSEKQVSQAARELNIAKGELLLAARLRLFEMGKM